MFEATVHSDSNTFYHISNSVIDAAQKKMGITFPADLLQFYKEAGYGFLHSDRENFNRLMDPSSICEFRSRTGQFADNPELDLYSESESDKLIFFEICENYFLSIGFSSWNLGKIYDGNTKIADSLDEFLEKYQINEAYFYEEKE
ncbi:MAG: SMI1/KNR4 family protein [Eubacterium sp.]|jgi:hypothetical protein|uniref:SMI1/KNR4 family protein n=1 Tax=Eubacterium sp. F2 TaxID=3381348 RepID=UPI00390814CC|nr:SMI1/KNR4 family protein [Eubacterium sp.]MCI2196525.1 SMI1/KNR4 family protein [Eubacterium sp.]